MSDANLPAIPPQPNSEVPALDSASPAWRLSEKGRQALAHAIAMRRTTHGFYASVPFLCKASACRFAAVCDPYQQGLVQEGDRCVLEIAEIIERYRGYATELQLQPDSLVDLGLLKDLIDCDIMMERADKQLAVDGRIIEHVVVGVGENGQPIRRPEIHKAIEIKEKMQKRKNEILQLLNATRKDKARAAQAAMDPSSHAAKIREIFEILQRSEQARPIVVEVEAKVEESPTEEKESTGS